MIPIALAVALCERGYSRVRITRSVCQGNCETIEFMVLAPGVHARRGSALVILDELRSLNLEQARQARTTRS